MLTFKQKSLFIVSSLLFLLIILGYQRVLAQSPIPRPEATKITKVTSTEVFFSAQINPNSEPTYVKFQYDTTTNLDKSIDAELNYFDKTYNTNQTVTARVTGLSPGTRYFYLVQQTNSCVLNGKIEEFRILKKRHKINCSQLYVFFC